MKYVDKTLCTTFWLELHMSASHESLRIMNSTTSDYRIWKIQNYRYLSPIYNIRNDNQYGWSWWAGLNVHTRNNVTCVIELLELSHALAHKHKLHEISKCEICGQTLCMTFWLEFHMSASHESLRKTNYYQKIAQAVSLIPRKRDLKKRHANTRVNFAIRHSYWI